MAGGEQHIFKMIDIIQMQLRLKVFFCFHKASSSTVISLVFSSDLHINCLYYRYQIIIYMMAQSTINNYDDQPVSERKSTPTSAGDSLLVRENKMRACQCTGVHKTNNKRTSTETYFIHILNNTNTCPWNICALHSLPLGRSDMGNCGVLVPRASKDS